MINVLLIHVLTDIFHLPVFLKISTPWSRKEQSWKYHWIRIMAASCHSVCSSSKIIKIRVLYNVDVVRFATFLPVHFVVLRPGF